MNLGVIALVVLALAVLRWRRAPMLAWVAAWWLGVLAFLLWGFVTPIPHSVVKLFMAIVSGALLAYVTSDRQRLAAVRDPLLAFLTEPRWAPWLAVAVVAIPAGVAASIYLDMTRPPKAPSFARTVHPAPPETITVHGETFDLRTLGNPFRPLESADPDAFRQHLESGRRIYYANCFFCHGDLLKGEGMAAHGLNPIPTNFQDPGTIAMLQESFLFWRIAKGGVGLPTEGGPWASAMPAWERFLQEEEIWDVILFLYDFTQQRPRARQEVHE